MAPDIIAKVENLSKNFGGISAVDNLTFDIREKEIMGIIGPNGAGKTTVFNLITGVYKPTSGRIFLDGKEITSLNPAVIVKKGISRTFQNIRLFNKLSVMDNVVTALDLNHPMYSIAESLFLNIPFADGKVKRSERRLREMALKYLDMVGVSHFAGSRADSLPYGYQRKLEIARALALEPRLLLLDEPAAGMNPEESMELARLIQNIKRECDITILLIEHHMDLIMYLCQHIIVMNFGAELAQGTPAEIQANPAVLTAYLGEGPEPARAVESPEPVRAVERPKPACVGEGPEAIHPAKGPEDIA